jgi:hypothetical protein
MRLNLKKLSSLTLLSLLFGAMSMPAYAATKTQSAATSSQANISGQVTQSYNADASVQVGMIVELKSKDSSTVTPLPNEDIKNMLGIVVPANNATIVLTPQDIKQQQVLVATGGRYGVLVSNQNGPVKTGDSLTISSIAGVAMKADDKQPQIVGKAASSFTGSANVISTVKLTDSTGQNANVTIGRVTLDIGIMHNPLFSRSADYVPTFLAKVASGIANKPVSAARIYLSLAILLITSILTGNILYSGIRSGMIAVGRNPLSKKSIIRSLFQTVIAGLIIFVAAVFAVYLLLKL